MKIDDLKIIIKTLCRARWETLLCSFTLVFTSSHVRWLFRDILCWFHMTNGPQQTSTKGLETDDTLYSGVPLQSLGGKMKLGKIGAAGCHVTFSLCLLIVFAFTSGLIGELLRVSAFEHGTVLKAETGFERGSRQLFLAPAVRQWNSSRLDKVINAALSPGVVPFLKSPKWAHGGALCSSCPCLPSFTSGSFHQGEKVVAWVRRC